MIHVCYNVNNKIFKGLLLSIMSVAKHASLPVYFHILSMDMSERNPDWLPMSEGELALIEKAITGYDARNKVEQIDCKALYAEYFARGRNQRSFYTPYAMLRLFLDKITLDGNPSKTLYLDTDTMCLKDIKELWDVDITDYEFGASLDHAGKFWVDVDYCNSGVMTINLDKIKQTDLLAKTRERVFKLTMFMPDQSSLNYLAVAKLILPRKFNEQRKVTENTVIRHFCRAFRFLPYPHIESVKQWEIDKVHNVLKLHALDDVYEDLEKLGV